MTIRTNTRDGSEIDLVGSAFVVTVGSEEIELKTSATRFWSTPSRYEVTGVRVDEASGTITVMFARDLEPPRVREATFDLDTGVRISQTSDLTARQIEFLEMSGVYGATAGLDENGDLNGNGIVATPPTVGVTGMVATNGLAGDATALFALDGGGFGIASESASDARKIFGQRGDYVLPRDFEAVAVRAGDGGFYLLMSKTERDNSVTFQEQFIVDNGVSLAAAGAPVTLIGRALIDAENAYNLDFNNDGIIGDADLVVARLDSAVNDPTGLGANGSLTDDPEGGIGIYRTQVGRFVIAEEAQQVGQVAGTTGPEPVGPSIFLKTATGADWTAPSGSVIFAVREVGTSGAYQFITRDGNLGASSTSYRVFDVSSTGVVGASVTVDYRQLIQLERTFRQDFDGNGVIGDVAGPRSDASVRIGNGERALYLSEGNALFISADLDRMGETIWNDPADTNLLLRTLNGITSEDGRVWSPALSASGAEAIAVRETASTYIVLSRVPSVVNPQSWEDYTYIEQSFSKTGIEVRGRFIVDITAQHEALYFQDFNGDGIIDLTTVSFTNTAQFVTPPNGARLDGHRLILTAEQAHAMSNGQLTGDGVLAVEGTGALDIGTPEAAAIFRDGAFEINRKFFLETPHDPVTGSDSLTLTVTGSGTFVNFRFTVPDHALGETSMVKLSGLPQGVTALLINLEGDLLEGMFLSGGIYVLRLDTTAADTRSFSFTLEQELPDGWGRAAIARDNVLQIADTTLTTDLDLRQVDPDHVVLRFGTPEGTSLEVPAGRTLTIHAEHAAALTLTGDGTVVLLGDLRGHDFTGVQVATIDFSQADVIGTGEIDQEPFELNFPTDAALWPAFELGNLWIIRGGQADIVSKTDDLKIDGTLTTADEFGRTSVGNIRIVDTVQALDLSGVDVAYIDMAGATGTPSALPAIDAGRFVVLRADQATGLVGDFGGARLHLVSDMTGYSGIDQSIQDYSLVNYLANNEVDFSQINLGGGMFTAIVRSDLTINTASDLGALQVTVQGAGTTLALTGAQADGRIINDSVSIWTRDTTRDVPQTDVAGRVVITDAANGIDLSNLGLVVGVDANTGEPNGTTTPNDNLYVTLAFNGGEAGAAFDFTQNTTFGDAPTELVRATDGLPPPALRIDAYDVAAGVTVTLRADQASFREAGGAGKIEIIGLDAGTDLWGFQRGTSPTVDVTVAVGDGFLDLRPNTSLDDAVDSYDLGARATQMTEVQASGRTITGATATALEVHGLLGGTNLANVSDGLDVTTFQTGAVNIRGNLNLATVDTFDIGSGNVLRADSALLGDSVAFIDGTAEIYVAANEVLTKTFEFNGAIDATLHLATGADIKGATLTGVDTYALENDASVTMSIAQHNDVTSITGAGAETITFSDPGAATGFAAIESYVLADGANTFTLGALAQNVTGGTGANTLVFGTGAYTGTFTGFGVGDTYQVVDGTDLSGTTGLGSGILDFQNLPATVTLNAEQNGALTIMNASNAQTIVVSQSDIFTADAEIETYRLTGASEITVAAGTNVEVVAGDDADQIVIVDGLTTTGTYNLGGGSGDTVSIIATSDISASTFTSVERVTLDEDVNATMTIAQNTLISTAAGTNQVTLFDPGVATGAAEVETYVLANGANTFTLGAAGQNVTGGTGNDTVIIGEEVEATGTYDLGDGTNTLRLENGANIAGVNAGGATTATTLFVESAATMTAAQHIDATVQGDSEAETTITFAGRVFRSAGEFEEALQAAAGIDAYVLGGAAGDRNMIDLGANGQSVTGGAANDSVWIGNFTPGAIQLGAGDNVLGLHRGNSIVAAGENIAEGGSLTIMLYQSSGPVTMTRSQHEAATAITNDIAVFGLPHFPQDNDDIAVAIHDGGEITAKANVTEYHLQSADGNTVTLTAATTGTSVFADAGNVTVEIDGLTLTSQSKLDGGADSRIKIAVSGTTDLTNATLIGVNEITMAEGATLSLTAAQADTLSVTGGGTVIVEGIDVATANLSSIVTGRLEVHLDYSTGTVDLRGNDTLGSVDRYELTGFGSLSFVLTGEQASGVTIESVSVGNNHEPLIIGMPSDADFTGISARNFYVILDDNVELADTAHLGDISGLFLGGKELSIAADLLPKANETEHPLKDVIRLNNENNPFWYREFEPDDDSTGAIVVRGVQEDTHLWLFNHFNFGRPPVTARIDDGTTVDLRGNTTTDVLVTIYEVQTGATLTLTESQVTNMAHPTVGGLTMVSVIGDGKLVVDGLAPGTDLSQVAESLTLGVLVTSDVDVTQNTTLGNVDEFIVSSGATLTLTAAQADGVSVTGAGNVIITALGGSDANISGIMVSGDVSLDAGNPNPVLEAGFTFDAREYKVIGTGTLDISAVTNVAATGFDVAAGSELLATAAQIQGMILGVDALKGAGSVVLTGVNEMTSIDAGIFGGSLTVTAVLGEDFAFADIPEWATRLKLDGNIVTLGYEELNEITLEPGPGRLVLTGQVPEILDLAGIPAGTIVELSGLCSDCTIQIINRADGVFVNPGENLVGLLMVNVGGTEPETLAIKGSIQDAINEANSGDAITVGAGEFFAPRLGFIDVNKPVSLWGAQVGNKSDGSDVRSGGESVIKVSADFDSGWEFVWGSNRPADNVIAGTAASALMVRVTADNVTIDGFTFTNFHRDAINVRSIEQEGSPDLSNISIMNNVIVMEGTRGESFTDPTESRFNQYNAIVFGEGVGDPVRSGFEPTFSNMVVSGNFVDITHNSNFFSGARGLILSNHFTEGEGLIYDNFTITDNIFSTYFDVFVSGQVAKTFFENGQISGNTFNGTRGITGPNFKVVEITGNSFDTALYGIEISADGTLIDGNTFTTGRLYGVHLKDNTGLDGHATSANTVSNNDFTYNIVETTDGRFVGGIAFFDVEAFASGGLSGNTFNDAGVSESTVTYETFRFVPGTSEADVLTSTGLDEVFVGGAGADTFVFSGVDIGNDVIADFVSGRDKISFEGLAVSSLDDLDLVVQEGNKIITALDGQFEGMITLLGVTSLSLEEDFVFDTQA